MMRYLYAIIIGLFLTACFNSSLPKKIHIGALDQGSWNGLVMTDPELGHFGFRFNTLNLQAADTSYLMAKPLDFSVSYANNGDSIYHAVSKVGTHASDASYASLQWQHLENTWHLEWSVIDQRSVVGTISSLHTEGENSGGLVVECYIPWSLDDSLSLTDQGVHTSHYYLSLSDTPDQVIVSPDSLIRSDELLSAINRPAVAPTLTKGKFIYLVYHQNTKGLAFVANQRQFEEPNSDMISHLLSTKKIETEDQRVSIQANGQPIAGTIIDNLNWMRSYIPDSDYEYVPAGRTWDWGGWAIFEWDAFFNSLLLSLDNLALAKENMKALYWTQYENGNLPNYRCGDSGSKAHSQPPVGAYIVWKLYLKTQDRDWLTISYEPLQKWYQWWYGKANQGHPRRDGNQDGLFEWGADASPEVGFTPKLRTAKFESGADDAAIFDGASYDTNTWTINLNAVGLNSLMALTAEYMSKIARELGDTTAAEQYALDRQVLADLINKQLWDEKDQRYKDQYWNGEWSDRFGPQHFYPLIAGICSDAQAQALQKHLLDTTVFWGEHVIPTISRNDTSFQDQQYWRGSIWAPTNYLVYQGLERYHMDSTSHYFAQKSLVLFMKNYEAEGTCQENFNSITGEGGGQKYQSWAGLFPMLYVENYIDADPYSEAFKLRVGHILSDTVSITNIRLQGDVYDFTQNGQEMHLMKNGNVVFKSTMPVVFRDLKIGKESISGEVYAMSYGEVELPDYHANIRVHPGQNRFNIKEKQEL